MASPLLRLTPLLLLTFGALGQELPERAGASGSEPIPKLMLNDLPDLGPADLLLPKDGPRGGETERPTSLDVAKLHGELEHAKKTAAQRERFYRAGVVSKVDAEQAALHVVRLTKDLAGARAEACALAIEDLKRRTGAGEANAEALATAMRELASLQTTAKDATDRWIQAQRAAAELRVQRERKLLAVGVGSRTQVKRAEAALLNLTSSVHQ